MSRHLQDTDWAYLAGFIDGEGCISTHPGNGSNPNHKRWRPIFSAQQADQVYLLSIYEKFGIGHFMLKKTKTSINGRWVVNKPLELQLMLTKAMPYLKLKKFQAELALEIIGGTSDRDKVQLLSALKAHEKLP
jgi:hypothetical protein